MFHLLVFVRSISDNLRKTRIHFSSIFSVQGILIHGLFLLFYSVNYGGLLRISVSSLKCRRTLKVYFITRGFLVFFYITYNVEGINKKSVSPGVFTKRNVIGFKLSSCTAALLWTKTNATTKLQKLQ